MIPLAIALPSLVVVLYVGVWRESPPSKFHSLGVVAQNEVKRGSNQPLPPACETRRSKQAKVKLAPETPVGDTDLPLSETSGQHADTCKQIMAEKPAPVVTSAFGRGLRMDIVVHVEPKLNLLPWEDQCGDATVDVVISGTHSFWRDHRKLQQHETRLALGWDEESDPNETTRSVITIPDLLKPLATLNSDSQAPLHPSFDTYTSLNQEQQLDLQRSERAWITSVEWGSEIGKKPIHFRFQTNWVEKRGVGSCYVVLPSLSANNFLPGQEAAACALAQRQGEEPLDCTSEEVVYDYLSHADPPTHGRVVLSMEDNNLEESTPEPNDYEAIWRPGPEHENPDVNLITASRAGEEHAAPVWTCLPTQDLSFLRGEHSSIPPAGSFAGNACGAIAVVEPPAAEEVRTTIILIGTVLAAIFAEQFFEALFRRYRRRREGAT